MLLRGKNLYQVQWRVGLFSLLPDVDHDPLVRQRQQLRPLLRQRPGREAVRKEVVLQQTGSQG